MPSENVAADTPQLPPSLQADHQEFTRTLSGQSSREGEDIRVLHLLTKFGLLVYEHADRFSLISKKDRSSLFTRHILDSLNPASLFDRPPTSALDVGSGAGFPGIPLAVLWPETRITLVESREKKAAFLERAVRELELKNAGVVPTRVEDLAAGSWTHARTSSEEPGFDSVFIRALASLPKLLGLVGPMCAPGAHWVYFLGKSSSADEIMAGLGSLGLGAEVASGQFGGQLLHGRLGDLGQRGSGSLSDD